MLIVFEDHDKLMTFTIRLVSFLFIGAYRLLALFGCLSVVYYSWLFRANLLIMFVSLLFTDFLCCSFDDCVLGFVRLLRAYLWITCVGLLICVLFFIVWV